MKNQKTQVFLVSVILLALGLLVGCKSKKALVDDGSLTKDWKFNTAMNDVLQKELQYTTLSTKGSLELKQGASGKKFTTYYKIIKDRVMQASVRMPIIGEVMRVNFTPDSIVVMDRVRGRYTAERFAESKFLKSTDLNYYNLQSLLTNGLFLPGEKTIEPEDYSKFKMSSVTDVLMLQTAGKPDLIFNFAVGAQEKVISVLITKKDFDATMQFTYDNFINDKGRVYPTTLDASLSWGDHNMGMVISYSTLDIDKSNMTVDTSIPNKYDKVSFETLIEPYIKK